MYVGNPPVGFLDPGTGLLWTMLPNVIKQFLQSVRSPAPPPDAEKSEWVSMDKQQTFGHAKWLNGAQIESFLVNDLSTAHVTLPPNTTLNDLARPVLAQQGRFIAVLEMDGAFLRVVDRVSVLESVGGEFLKQSGADKS